MPKRLHAKSAYFLNTASGSKASGSFGNWGRLSTSRGGKYTIINLHSRPLGNPNPVHRFSSTNQPPRP